MENRDARKAMRHLRRAQELIDSQGFGSDAEDGQEITQGFGGMKDYLDWFMSLLWRNKDFNLSALNVNLQKKIVRNLSPEDRKRMMCASRGARELVQEVYNEEADERAQDPAKLTDELIRAVREKDDVMVDLLLKRGARATADVLREAVNWGNKRTVQSLLANASINETELMNDSIYTEILFDAMFRIPIDMYPSSYEIAQLILDNEAKTTENVPVDLKLIIDLFYDRDKNRLKDKVRDKNNLDGAFRLLETLLKKGSLYWRSLHGQLDIQQWLPRETLDKLHQMLDKYIHNGM